VTFSEPVANDVFFCKQPLALKCNVNTLCDFFLIVRVHEEYKTLSKCLRVTFFGRLSTLCREQIWIFSESSLEVFVMQRNSLGIILGD